MECHERLGVHHYSHVGKSETSCRRGRQVSLEYESIAFVDIHCRVTPHSDLIAEQLTVTGISSSVSAAFRHLAPALVTLHADLDPKPGRNTVSFIVLLEVSDLSMLRSWAGPANRCERKL